MNYWISGHRENLNQMLKRIDVLLINDGEAKMLAGDNSLPRAARKVMDNGAAGAGHQAWRVRRNHFLPRSRVRGRRSSLPRSGMPIDEVRDPTGAGDSFAGGFMGYLASQGEINRRVSAACHVLWQRDGLVRCRALRHRASAVADARRD